MNRLRRSFGLALVLCSVVFRPPQVQGEPACSAVQQGTRVELRSPCFVFRLDTAAGGRFSCMEAVYGVAEAGSARQAFLNEG